MDEEELLLLNTWNNCLILDEIARTKFLNDTKELWENAGKHEGKPIVGEHLKPEERWTFRILIAHYLNYAYARAIHKAKTSTTSNQHTVPDFNNKTFALYTTEQPFVYEGETYAGYSINSAVSVETNSLFRHQSEIVPNKKISIVENIYDWDDSSSPEEKKLTEEFLAMLETDSSTIIRNMAPNYKVNMTDRIALSVYFTAQSLRTTNRKNALDMNYNNVVELVEQTRDKKLSMNSPTVENTIREQIEDILGPRNFGMNLINQLGVVNIHEFMFMRQWNWVEIPEGNIFSLDPVASYSEHLQTLYSGGVGVASRFIFPIQRNLTVIMNHPVYFIEEGQDSVLTLDDKEREFLLRIEIFNYGPWAKIYYHPEDSPIKEKTFWNEELVYVSRRGSNHYSNEKFIDKALSDLIEVPKIFAEK